MPEETFPRRDEVRKPCGGVAISCAGSARESGPRAREARANPVLVRGKRARFRFAAIGSLKQRMPWRRRHRRYKHIRYF